MSDVDEIKTKAVPVLKQAGVTRSALFGSHSRGEADENSDIDILVQFPRGKTLLDLVGLQLELEEVLGKKVDLVTFNSIEPMLKETIEKDQIALF